MAFFRNSAWQTLMSDQKLGDYRPVGSMLSSDPEFSYVEVG